MAGTGSTPNLVRVPHAEQYAGVWGIDAKHMGFLAGSISAMDLRGHVRDGVRGGFNPETGDFEVPKVRVQRAANGVAIIELRGTMFKYDSSLSDAPSTVRLTKAVRDLTGENVSGIVLAVDSPGGLTAGAHELHLALRSAVKAGIPVVAAVDGLCCSAAYWAAAGARAIVASAGSIIGSIGTFTVFEDVRAMYAAAGVSVDVISSGEHKGAGVRGTSLSESQRAEVQRTINEHTALFTRAIASGRGVTMDAASAWADGRVHLAESALTMRLIDEVADADVVERAVALCGELRARPNGSPSSHGDQDMKIKGQNGAATPTADAEAMSDAELRAWLAEHRPAVLADAKADTEEDPETDPEQVEDDPEKVTEASGPASIAELKAAGITDNAFIVGAIERGLTLSAAALAWETVTASGPGGAGHAHKAQPRSADPAGPGRGAASGADGASAPAGTLASFLAQHKSDADIAGLCERLKMDAQTFAGWAQEQHKTGVKDIKGALRDWADLAAPIR